MKKRFFFLIGVVIFISLGCNLFIRNQGNIVYQAVDKDGEALPELVVLDSNGKEKSRFDLPDKDTKFYPYRIPIKDRVFFQDPFNEQWFLFDITEGDFTDYDGFGDAKDSAQPCSFGANWVLLCGGSQGLYLLETESGDVSEIDIPSDPNSVVPLFPQLILVNPDETYSLLGIRNERWLVEFENPDDPRKLGDEGYVGNAAFSDDGKSILYSQITEDRETQVFKEQIDGSDSEEIFSGSKIDRVYFVPKHEQLVLAYRDAISLFSLDDEEETELFEIDDIVREAHFDPAGEKALFGVGGFKDETITWTYADLKTGESETLDDLDGYVRAYSPAFHLSRWFFLTDAISSQMSDGSEANIASLDLETGQVNELLTIEDANFFDFTAFSEDGRVALVIVFTKDGTQLWLLQADQEDAQLLAEERSVSGSLSPDGQWVVVGEMKKDGDQTKTSIKIVEVKSGEETRIGEGIMPVWVQP
jgi:hypothetical protein